MNPLKETFILNKTCFRFLKRTRSVMRGVVVDRGLIMHGVDGRTDLITKTRIEQMSRKEGNGTRYKKTRPGRSVRVCGME